LTAARTRVLATVAGSPMSRPAPRARASAPLRRLAPELEAKLAARADRDRLPATVAASSPQSLRRVVVPSAALAVVDAVAVVAALAAGHWVLAVLAGVLFVPLAGLAVVGAGLLRRDPLRLTSAERRTIAAASQWDTRQQWTGPLEFGTERGLVVAAAREAERITRSPRWTSGALVEQRIRLDLGAELDQIDEQAHRIAVARQQQLAAQPAPDAAVIDRAWESTLDRVAALSAYADNLDGTAPVSAAGTDAVGNSDLLTGSARDELAGQQMLALWTYLDANRGDPFG
jgi:hypothetical protein